LFFLQGLVVHAEQAPIRRNFGKIDILRKNMRPDVGRELCEISVGFERVPEMAAGETIDDPGSIDMASQIEIARFVRDNDSPLFCARLHLRCG
jgi:hypothetical protein